MEIPHAHAPASLLPKTIDNRSDCEDDVGFRGVTYVKHMLWSFLQKWLMA